MKLKDFSIGLKLQLRIQATLMLIALAAHAVMVGTGVGKYSKAEPKWYDVFNLALMVSTTTGMSTCVPENAAAMSVTWIHTVLIFLVLAM